MFDYIIIDGNNIAFRAWKAHESNPLTNEGKDVSAIFGFINSVKSILTDPSLTVKKIVIVWDFGRSSYRSAIFPNYKGNRERDPLFEDFIRQMDEIQHIMSLFPVTQLKMTKVEGDDLIGAVHYLAPSAKKLIVSGDKDLAQFVDENTAMYKLGMFARHHELITKDNFSNIISKCTIPFNKIIDYKIVCGDKSDNIPGIRGIGDKSMQVIFDTFGGLTEAIDAYKEMMKRAEEPEMAKSLKENKALIKNLAKLNDNAELIDLNRKLIDIRYALTKDIVVYVGQELTKERYPDVEGIKNELGRLNFNSMLRDLPRFLMAFGL